jgi:hypothetical protein
MDLTIQTLLGLLKPEIILKALELLHPELSDQIEAERMKFRKEREEKRAKFLEALDKMDVATLNAMSAEFWS